MPFLNCSRVSLCLLLVATQTITAAAHPGHGDPGATHHFTSPGHLATMIGFAGAITILLWMQRRISKSRQRSFAELSARSQQH